MKLRRVLSVALSLALALPVGLVPAPAMAAGRLTATITPSAAVVPVGGRSWYKTDVSLTLTASDTIQPPSADLSMNSVVTGPAGSVATTDYASVITTVVPFSVEGTYSVTLTASSTANATLTASSFVFGIDKTAPATTTASVPSGTEFRGPGTITLSPSDALSGVSKVDWQLTSSVIATQTGTGTSVVVPTTTGVYALKYLATDVAGNQETTRTLAFAVFPYDSTPPSTTATGIPAGWSRTDVQVSLRAVDDSRGVIWTRYSLDGTGTTTLTAPSAVITFTPPAFTVSKEGTTTLEFRSSDASGNLESTKTATIRIDKTAPSITATGGGVFSVPATVSAVATDATSGLRSLKFRIAPAGLLTTGSVVPVSQPGTTVVEFVAEDIAGNTRSQLVTVTIQALVTPSAVISPPKVVYGTRARVTGVLSGPPSLLAGAPVALQSLTGTSTWVNVPGVTITPSAAGTFTTTFLPKAKGTYRVIVVPGGAYLPSSASATYTVYVQAKVTLSALPAIRAGRAFTVRGVVYPAHRGSVRIEAYQRINGVYRLKTWRYVTSASTGAFTGALTLGRGVWRIRAIHADAAHLKGVSVYRYATIR